MMTLNRRMKGLIRTLCQQYRKALPNEDDTAVMVMTVVVNRYVKRNGYIPGTHLTPDDVGQNSLVRFHVRNPDSSQPAGRLEILYIWLLVLCDAY